MFPVVHLFTGLHWINPYQEKIHSCKRFQISAVLLSQIFTDPDTSLAMTLFLIPLGMPSWHNSLVSTEESQGFWTSQDKWAQRTSRADDGDLLKAAFERMLERLHGGNVLFQCQPCAGNRNQTSHNNDTFTRWPIRCQLDELSLGNLCVFMWQIARARERLQGWKWIQHDKFLNYDADYGWFWERAHAAGGDDSNRWQDGTTQWVRDVRGMLVFGVSFRLEQFPQYRAGGVKPNLLFVLKKMGLLL